MSKFRSDSNLSAEFCSCLQSSRLWGIPALIQTHGEFLRIGIGRHVIGRSFGAMEGHGSNSLGIYLLLLPFYFVTIFASFFPWSIKLPMAREKTLARAERGLRAGGYDGQIDIYFSPARELFSSFSA